MPGLAVRGLKVAFDTDDGLVRAVDGVDFDIAPGVRMGFVGESGSGKTTTALALMGMIEPPGKVTAGEADLDGIRLLHLDEPAHARTRLQDVSYIPQGAMNSLNPVARIEQQIIDGMIDHGLDLGRKAMRARAERLLSRVGLPAEVARMYPHELSGGMKQRVCIAIAICLEPKLIIADEPTSALDVISQRRVMETLRNVQEEIGASLVLIGHDMGLMAQFVDELMVMRHGVVVERGLTRQVFKAAEHPYTRTLISSVPSLDSRGAAPSAPAVKRKGDGEALVELDGVMKRYGRGFFRKPDAPALHPLSFRLTGERPRIIAVVGQSGSGKTTLGSLMLGFLPPTAGRVLYRGHDLRSFKGGTLKGFRKEVQAVFQDPYASYNPFYKVDHALTRPLYNFGLVRNRDEAYDHMVRACETVGLDPAQTIHRFAHQLSGGQRQRLMVGRAVMLSPKLLIADEPVSMVDASLRSTILGHLRALKDEHGVSIVYITHDLATAYQVSDYVLVLYKGRLVEAGTPELVIREPEHPYTRLLVESIPWPDPDRPWATGNRVEADLAELDRHPLDEPAIVRSEIEAFTLHPH